MSIYLERYAYYKEELIKELPSENLYLSVVIPCFNETNILDTLYSLNECDITEKGVEVIIVVNNSEKASSSIRDQNEKTIAEIEIFRLSNTKLNIKILKELHLPKKHAGVGLARKIGMDEAVRRNPNGVIVCLDADSMVEKNYLSSIEALFTKDDNGLSPHGCSIHFEHPTEGILDEKIYEGITAYELHLRYFINAQRFANHPHAYQTIGSSMAVRSHIYQKVMGMPKKQAGEDFYFLQKVIQLGDFSELYSTKVIPSPRVSDRVPFGTGKAIGDYLETNKESLTYNFQTFIDLKLSISKVKELYNLQFSTLPSSFTNFLKSIDGMKEIEEIRKRSKTIVIFTKHFFNWFNAFQVMKYVHYCRDHFYPNEKLINACIKLTHLELDNEKLFLTYFREMDISTAR